MKVKDFINKMRSRIKSLEDNREADVLRIAQDTSALIKLRIQTSGKNYEGQFFSPYTKSYKKNRNKSGYQTNYVDFTRTGRLWGSVQPRLLSKSRFKVSYSLEPTGQDNIDKARGQVKKRGNILQPSREEIKLARQANIKRIINRLSQ